MRTNHRMDMITMNDRLHMNRSLFRMPLRMLSRLLAVVVAFALTSPSTARADEPKVEKLIVFPMQVNLTDAKDRQSVVVQAVYDNGLTDDVTLKAKMTFGNAALVTAENAVIKPVVDGETELKIEFAGQTVALPVKVSGSKSVLPISFRMDVMPVFMKANCNTGSCHGAARGKDGFRLSLFGFDPEGDYHRITREMPGRRLNQSAPAESTLVEKAVGAGRVRIGRAPVKTKICINRKPSIKIIWIDCKTIIA